MGFLKYFPTLFLEPGTSSIKTIKWGPFVIQLNPEEYTLLAQQAEHYTSRSERSDVCVRYFSTALKPRKEASLLCTLCFRGPGILQPYANAPGNTQVALSL